MSQNVSVLDSANTSQSVLISGNTSRALSNSTLISASSSAITSLNTRSNLELYEQHPAVAWDDLRVAANVTKPGSSSPTWTNTQGGLYSWGFSHAATNSVHFNVQMPHAYKEGSNITPHVHWQQLDTDTGHGVVWGLEYTWTNNAATEGSPTTIYVTGTTNSTQYYNHKNYFSAIVGTGKTISSMLVCRLFRLHTDPADDYPAVAILWEFDLHYQLDSVGSQNATSK